MLWLECVLLAQHIGLWLESKLLALYSWFILIFNERTQNEALVMSLSPKHLKYYEYLHIHIDPSSPNLAKLIVFYGGKLCRQPRMLTPELSMSLVIIWDLNWNIEMKFPKLKERKQNKTWKKDTTSDATSMNVPSIPSSQFVAKMSFFCLLLYRKWWCS